MYRRLTLAFSPARLIRHAPASPSSFVCSPALIIISRSPHHTALQRGLMTTTTTTTTNTTTRATATMSPLTPTYDNALHLLSLLQSNKTVINLFAASSATADINASAIPEMTAWLLRAGYTPSDLAAHLRCIHVAGTKGKGSVCAFTTAILRQYPHVAGKVGTYTSPHLVSVRERICIDGEPIPQDKFAQYFFELWDALSDAARREGAVIPEGDALGVDGPSTKPFYFRFLTLLAFHAFVREGVRSAIVECGIGGEYDSTNVLPAEAVTATVVTQLGIDHVNLLGDTVEKIAWNKAGIFKKGVPAVTYQAGRNSSKGSDSVLRVLRERAQEKGGQLSILDDIALNKWKGVPDARLEGAFQKSNMALATIISRHHLQSLGHKLDDDNNDLTLLTSLPPPIHTALQTAKLRGRCETIVQDRIEWHLDGAHTEDSLVQVAKWFATKILCPPDSIRVLIFNQQDRDSPKLLRTLLDALQDATNTPNRKIFHHAFCPTNDEVGRLTSPKADMTVQRRNCDVVRQFCPFTTAIPADSVSFALDMARNVMLGSKKSKDNFKVQVLVTGSFNLVGPALRLLEPGSDP